MFKGTVDFQARIKGNGLTFPLFEFHPKEPSVAKVEIEGPSGDHIRCTVHLTFVATRDEGLALATQVVAQVIDRIAFFHNISIENARNTGDQFFPVTSRTNAAYTSVSASSAAFWDIARVVVEVNPARLKEELERVLPLGEHNFALFRSARLSMSPVEEFMHLYSILLMLHDDRQRRVDRFIIGQEPSVPQTQHPDKPVGVMETIYTRLRNEFAHRRPGVNTDATKGEMANCLGSLLTLTKRAIELNP